MDDEFVEREVVLPNGPLRLLQPAESAELPDADGIEWAPIAPYWSVLWRSGVALAAELDEADLAGLRIAEVGCGLGVPSLAAARRGAEVLATDADPEAIEMLERNAGLNDLAVVTAVVDWAEPSGLLAEAPFDLVIAADVLYERGSAELLADLLPRLAPDAWVADPGRPTAAAMIGRLELARPPETAKRGVAAIHRLAFAGGRPGPLRRG